MENFFNQKTTKERILWLIGVVVLLAIIVYGVRNFLLLKDENLVLKNKVLELDGFLSQSKNENLDLNTKLQDEQARNNSFEDAVNKVAGTVGTLEKLSKTDKELLMKYSKIYFLNENYVPSELTDIESKYLYEKDRTLQIHSKVYPFLLRLIQAGNDDNVNLLIISAYRSFGTQEVLKSNYKVTYGAGTANQFSADQGYSEHQLGTTVDFTTPTVGATFSKFEKTKEYEWLKKNAYKFGFILSYPENNAYYKFEPWHWRFVGVTLATKLHNEDKYFYDLDQREIDKNLINIFD